MLNISRGNSRLLKALNEHSVEYLIVGGLAVSYYCRQRQVGDLDLIVNSTCENARKVRLALIGLGARNFDLRELTKLKIHVPFKFQHYDADIFTPERDFDFVPVFSESKKVKIDDTFGYIPSVDNLIDLISTDHAKGRHDISLLNQLTTKKQ